MIARLNSKQVVFCGIAVMMAFVLYHNERFLIEPSNPIWEHYWPFKWYLLPHGIFGATAPAAGAAPILRTSAATLHPTASHPGTFLCCGRVWSRAAWLLHPVLPGAHGNAALVYNSGSG